MMPQSMLLTRNRRTLSQFRDGEGVSERIDKREAIQPSIGQRAYYLPDKISDRYNKTTATPGVRASTVTIPGHPVNITPLDPIQHPKSPAPHIHATPAPHTPQPRIPHTKAPYSPKNPTLDLLLKAANDPAPLCSPVNVAHSLGALYPRDAWSRVAT